MGNNWSNNHDVFESRKLLTNSTFFFIFAFLVNFFVFKNILIPYLWVLILGFLVSSSIGLIFSNVKFLYKYIKSGRFFLLFHPFNILFQQSSVVIGIILLENYLHNSYQNYYFGVAFMILHFPVVFFKWAKLRWFYLAGTLLGGTLFSYLILNFSFGATLTYLIHYLIYVGIIYYLKDQNKI